MSVEEKDREKCFIPRSVILNVVFLDLLDMMVRLRVVHSLGTECRVSRLQQMAAYDPLFPSKISR